MKLMPRKRSRRDGDGDGDGTTLTLQKHMSRIRVTLWQGLRRAMGYDGTAAARPEGILNSTTMCHFFGKLKLAFASN